MFLSYGGYSNFIYSTHTLHLIEFLISTQKESTTESSYTKTRNVGRISPRFLNLAMSNTLGWTKPEDIWVEQLVRGFVSHVSITCQQPISHKLSLTTIVD